MSATITPITKDQEQQLLGALTSAIRDTNNGTPVNESLAKQAMANGFGPEFASRMVEAFNASKTIKHLNSTEGEKRAESFELADAQQVVAHMYSGAPKLTIKVSNTKITDPATVNFNLNPESAIRVSKLDKVAFEKVAKVYEKPMAMRMDTVLKDSRAFLTKVARARRELSMEHADLMDKVSSAAYDLAEAFRTWGHDPFHEVEYSLAGVHGKTLVKSAMDVVWGIHDLERTGEKRASSLPNRPTVLERTPCHQLGDKYIKLVKSSAEKRAELEEFNRKAKLVEDYFKTRITAINKKAADGAEGKKGPDFNKSVGSLLGPLSVAPRSVMSTIMFDDNADSGSDDAARTVSPVQESKIRQIRTKLMLNDMISNDSVISAYAPGDVFSAYNEVAEMVPGLATEPLLMRAMVARILQSGGRMDAHEIGALLKAEELRRKTRILGY